jgi:FKBP-type peptidyl-prolyl cis-trans isomerase FkpA
MNRARCNMPKLIIACLLLLGGVYFAARGLGLTPEQVEDQILLADLNLAEGVAFRSENARQPGVVTLANGLQVEVLVEGDGPIPTAEDWVRVQYRGWRIDGREFENSWRRGEPATVTVEKTIPGWQAVLVAIPAGSRVNLVVPPELAYGRPGSGVIGPEETLVFELELLGIVEPQAAYEPAEWEMPVPNLR